MNEIRVYRTWDGIFNNKSTCIAVLETPAFTQRQTLEATITGLKKAMIDRNVECAVFGAKAYSMLEKHLKYYFEGPGQTFTAANLEKTLSRAERDLVILPEIIG